MTPRPLRWAGALFWPMDCRIRVDANGASLNLTAEPVAEASVHADAPIVDVALGTEFRVEDGAAGERVFVVLVIDHQIGRTNALYLYAADPLLAEQQRMEREQKRTMIEKSLAHLRDHEHE